MTSLMLIISFILHVLTLMVVYKLFKQSQLLKAKNSNDDIMDLFEIYLEEIRNENKKLQDAISTPQKKTDSIYNQPLQEDRNNNETTYNRTAHDEANKQYTPPTPTTRIDDSYIPSSQGQILHWYNEGISEEEIARKLDCGITEVSLVIKLYKNNEDKA